MKDRYIFPAIFDYGDDGLSVIFSGSNLHQSHLGSFLFIQNPLCGNLKEIHKLESYGYIPPGLLHDHYFDIRTATMLLHLLYGQIMLLLHRKAPSTLCSSLEHKVAGNHGLLIAERLVELSSPNASVDRGAFWHYAAPLIILAYQLIADRHLYLVSRLSKIEHHYEHTRRHFVGW